MSGKIESPIRERAKVLWTEGMSSGEIAHLTGLSRNVVIGIVSRAGLQRANPSPARRAPAVPKRKAGGHPTVVTGWRSRKAKAMPKPKPAPVDPVPGVTVGTSSVCQFIAGEPEADAAICGHPGYPWCEHHRDRVFQKQPQAAA